MNDVLPVNFACRKYNIALSHFQAIKQRSPPKTEQTIINCFSSFTEFQSSFTIFYDVTDRNTTSPKIEPWVDKKHSQRRTAELWKSI